MKTQGDSAESVVQNSLLPVLIAALRISPLMGFAADAAKIWYPSSERSPKELSFDEKIDKIQRYLPKGLTEKILAQRDRIEGERKQVTVMFCDMEGFTSLSEMLWT